MHLVDSSVYWHARAKESRISADCMIDAGCARILRGIADDYDRIARWCEAQLVPGDSI